MGYRRLLVAGGGVAFAAALGLMSVSQGFIVLLIAWTVFFPASGGFVSLSQASLMDYDPARREQNMVRWEFTGWVAYALGPLALTGAIAVGLGWRMAFLTMAVMTIPAIVAVSRMRLAPGRSESEPRSPSFAEGVRTAVKALKRFRVVKWLALLQASDLMLDIFLGFLALYMVDVAGISESRAALTLSVWLGAGIIGNLLLIPLLERIRGLTYLRFSVVAVLALYPAFLIASSFEIKLIAVGLLGFASAGWYSILQGQAYSSLPGKERYYRRARQRIRHNRLGDPIRYWRGLGQLGAGHGDVAAPGGAGCSADWLDGEWVAGGAGVGFTAEDAESAEGGGWGNMAAV